MKDLLQKAWAEWVRLQPTVIHIESKQFCEYSAIDAKHLAALAERERAWKNYCKVRDSKPQLTHATATIG